MALLIDFSLSAKEAYRMAKEAYRMAAKYARGATCNVTGLLE